MFAKYICQVTTNYIVKQQFPFFFLKFSPKYSCGQTTYLLFQVSLAFTSLNFMSVSHNGHKSISTNQPCHTSLHFKRDLNWLTRSCVVTGFLCSRTALISSSVTGPVAELGAVLEEDDAPFGRAVFFAEDGVSSFPGLASCTM